MSKKKRYAVECDTPDRGRSTYPECWGAGGARGRILGEYDTLEAAIQACGSNPAESPAAVTPWIWDRRAGKVVGARRLRRVMAEAE